MRITFFGSSHGVPEAQRRCSSTLIEAGGRRYLLDMGTSAVECLVNRGQSPNDIDAVFLTHMHGDHSNGLISFVDLCSWFYKDAQMPVYLPGEWEKTVEALKGWLACNGTELSPKLTFKPVQAGPLYDDGTLRVTAYRTAHIRYSYAYLMEAEGKRVLFTGDLCTRGPKEDFPVEVFDKPLDLAVCESAHFPVTDYLPLWEPHYQNLKRVIITHYVTGHIPSFLKGQAELQKQGIPAGLSHDGMVVEV